MQEATTKQIDLMASIGYDGEGLTKEQARSFLMSQGNMMQAAHDSISDLGTPVYNAGEWRRVVDCVYCGAVWGNPKKGGSTKGEEAGYKAFSFSTVGGYCYCCKEGGGILEVARMINTEMGYLKTPDLDQEKPVVEESWNSQANSGRTYRSTKQWVKKIKEPKRKSAVSMNWQTYEGLNVTSRGLSDQDYNQAIEALNRKCGGIYHGGELVLYLDSIGCRWGYCNHTPTRRGLCLRVQGSRNGTITSLKRRVISEQEYTAPKWSHEVIESIDGLWFPFIEQPESVYDKIVVVVENQVTAAALQWRLRESLMCDDEFIFAAKKHYSGSIIDGKTGFSGCGFALAYDCDKTGRQSASRDFDALVAKEMPTVIISSRGDDKSCLLDRVCRKGKTEYDCDTALYSVIEASMVRIESLRDEMEL